MKLFGRKKDPDPQPQPQPEGMIEAYDAQGNQVRIPRSGWLSSVLMPGIQKEFNNPGPLYDLILGGVRDKFYAEMLDPALHLASIAPPEDRLNAVALVAHIQHKLSRFDDARNTLEEAVKEFGRTGLLLTNLGMVERGLNNEKKALEFFEEAVQVEPNYQDAILLLMNAYYDQSGGKARTEFLERAASLPGNWRALLWLAHFELAAKQLEPALVHYREVMSRVGELPFNAFEQASGDLGKNGYVKEMVDLCAPLYDPVKHGANAGNNLMTAYRDLGEVAPARRVLESLYKVRQPGWEPTLKYWEYAIGKLEHQFDERDWSQVRAELRWIEMPLWGRDDVAPSTLKIKSSDAIKIVVQVASAEMERPHGQKPVMEIPTGLGRFSRGMPAFIAEQIATNTSAHGILNVPIADDGSFLLSGVPLQIEDAQQAAPSADYLLALHIEARQLPWVVQARLIRPRDKSVVASWQRAFELASCESTAGELTESLIEWLESNAGVVATRGLFSAPGKSALVNYQILLDQALAIRIVTLCNTNGETLMSERSILDNALGLAKLEPTNAAIRLNAWSVFEEEARRRPDIGKEYWDRFNALESPPLSEEQEQMVGVLRRLASIAVAQPTSEL